MKTGDIVCWLIVDPETGELVMRCTSRDEARELARGGWASLQGGGDPVNTHEVLVAARAKIAKRENWTKYVLARTKRGFVVGPRTTGAACWCSYGAIDCVMPDHADGYSAYSTLDSFMDGDAPAFNDTHTHEEVLAAFDRAIEATKP